MPDSKIMLCPGEECGKPFFVNQYEFLTETSMEKGKIICPHCGLVMIGSSNMVFLTYALTAKEEERFRRG